MAHGHLTFLSGIAESCNVVFWTLAQPIGAKQLSRYAHLYGLGEATGIDAVQENPGVIPDPGWKARVLKQPWYGGDTLNAAVGQGYVLVTPIQVARLLAAVANGGTLVTPHVATAIVSPKGQILQRVAPPPSAHMHLSPRTLGVLRSGLAAVVTRGTATSIQIPGLAVAGKTGTAENPHGKPHAWFAGYAPAGNPRLVVVALVENVGFGADYAAPVVREVLQAAFGLRPSGGARP